MCGVDVDVLSDGLCSFLSMCLGIGICICVVMLLYWNMISLFGLNVV